ncbi:MAG: hypothetical protein AB1558_06140 [Thermodesulfobacteriota bacterium]
MAKIPKRPAEIFEEITDAYQRIFGADLLSIILFGSGAGEDYLPGTSDINFLVTLTDPGIERIEGALETVARWRKRSVAVPLFMTLAHLAGSQDTYPIELLNMKRHYRVVFGRDVLAELAFDRPHIRLQLERELRGKLLHLRSGYLETEGSAAKIRELITRSLTAFISLFCAILYLRGVEIPQGNRDIIRAAGEAFGIEHDVFLTCEEIRRKADHVGRSDITAVFLAYLKEVVRLCDRVDRMEI